MDAAEVQQLPVVTCPACGCQGHALEADGRTDVLHAPPQRHEEMYVRCIGILFTDTDAAKEWVNTHG